MTALIKIYKNTDTFKMDSWRLSNHLAAQNERGSTIILVVMVLFITMMLLASIIQTENVSFQHAAAVQKIVTQKQDFANYVYTALSNSTINSTMQIVTSDFNTGSFSIAGLSAGTVYPSMGLAASPTYITICGDSTAPCTGPGMTMVPTPGAATAPTPPYQQNDFNITYKYFDPGVEQTTTQVIGPLTLQYLPTPVGANTYSVGNVTIINTSASVCQQVFGLNYCASGGGRCPTCEAMGCCWTGTTCSCGGVACPIPTPPC